MLMAPPIRLTAVNQTPPVLSPPGPGAGRLHPQVGLRHARDMPEATRRDISILTSAGRTRLSPGQDALLGSSSHCDIAGPGAPPVVLRIYCLAAWPVAATEPILRLAVGGFAVRFPSPSAPPDAQVRGRRSVVRAEWPDGQLTTELELVESS